MNKETIVKSLAAVALVVAIVDFALSVTDSANVCSKYLDILFNILLVAMLLLGLRQRKP